MLLLRILVGLFVVWTVFPTLAQSPCQCFVKGVVLDRDSRQPIPGATVLIKETGQGTITDINGAYRLDKLCQGHYTLLSRIIGYKEVRQSIILAHNDTAEQQDLLLPEEVIHLNNINVTAQRTDALNSQPISTLEGRDLEQTRGQSLGDALRAINGVTTLQTGASITKPVIHGMHSNRVLILNNGIRQEGQQWGSEHAPEIDPFVASRVTVIKGASGVRYGSDAIGGVVLVEPAPLPTQSGLHGELNMVGFTNGRQGVASLQTEGAFGKSNAFGWRLQGTLKRGGNLQTPSYYLANTGLAEQNFSAAAGYRTGNWRSDVFYSRFNSKVGIFSGSHIGSLTDLQQVLETGQPLIKTGFSYTIGRPYQQIQHDLLKWKTTFKPSAGGEWNLTLARQFDDRMEYDLHRPRNDSLAGLNRPELRFRLTTYTGDLAYTHKPIGKLSGTAGISGLYQYNIMNGRPLIPNFRLYNTGLFWIEKLRTGKWEWEAGLRYDLRHMQAFRYVNGVLDQPAFVFSAGSGTLGTTYSVQEKWQLRFNAGTAWRAPNVSELFSGGVHHGAAAYEQGDINLRPETAYNLNLSSDYQGKRVQAEVNVFYNYLRNYIYLKPQDAPILTIRGAFPYFRYTQTDAIYTGVDATVNVKLLSGLNWTTRPSYLYVQDVRQNQPIVMIPPNRWENSLRYELAKAGNFRDAYLSIGNRSVARQNRVSANSDFMAPPPAYSLWNLSAGGLLPLSEHQQLELGVTVTNLFDVTYRDYLNRFRYFADDLGRNLSVRVKWRF
ncbi:TonB-dependent receptor [Nibrella viscosa]|uniref:TonB-dependent receptor n=1 Tax=Nibrella viscosa TaxID=1084524 RepID=A0ABP8KQV8_9BACT